MDPEQKTIKATIAMLIAGTCEANTALPLMLYQQATSTTPVTVTFTLHLVSAEIDQIRVGSDVTR